MINLSDKHIITFDDLSNNEILSIFETADDINTNPSKFFGQASGKIAATLFYEPSTRTRLSFESAVQKLGGGIISAWDVNASSASKGESLADTARVVSSYSDIMVIRHPWEGASRLAAEYSTVPVINAGDGSHEHPTQTLCDLYTLRERHGSLKGLNVAICGDLLHGRTVHSLAFALARFGSNIIFVPGDGNDIPDYVLRRLERDYKAHIQKEGLGILKVLFNNKGKSDNLDSINAIYVTPKEPHQLSMSCIKGNAVEFRIAQGESLSLYLTRRQTERGSIPTEEGNYPFLNEKSLSSSNFKDISILHPLPRLDEVSPEIDQDPRSLYFRQAAVGIPIRMSLILHALELKNIENKKLKASDTSHIPNVKYTRSDFICSNETCISNKESKFSKPTYEIVKDEQYKLRCLYCDLETICDIVGNIDSKFFYSTKLLDKFLPKVLLENVRFFKSQQEAELAGFKKASDRWNRLQWKNNNNRGWIETVAK
jgi:aspartate carbamoyltransferase catalytic subunit